MDFEATYAACFHKVFRFALSITGNAAEAEEVAQETFFRAMKNISSLKNDAAVDAWLFRMPVCQIRIADETETKVIYTWGDPLQQLSEDSLHFSGSFHAASTNDVDCINKAFLWNTEVFLTDPEREAFSIPEVSLIAFKNLTNNTPLATSVPMYKNQTVVSVVNAPAPNAQEIAQGFALRELQASPMATITPESTPAGQITIDATETPREANTSKTE